MQLWWSETKSNRAILFPDAFPLLYISIDDWSKRWQHKSVDGLSIDSFSTLVQEEQLCSDDDILIQGSFNFSRRQVKYSAEDFDLTFEFKLQSYEEKNKDPILRLSRESRVWSCHHLDDIKYLKDAVSTRWKATKWLPNWLLEPGKCWRNLTTWNNIWVSLYPSMNEDPLSRERWYLSTGYHFWRSYRQTELSFDPVCPNWNPIKVLP